MQHRSKSGSRRLAAIVGAASMSMLAVAPSARGLNITLVYNVAASAEPVGDPTGTSLTSLMQHIESRYEDIFETAHNITINYWYEDLASGVLGAHSLVSQSGGRETVGNIRFDPTANGSDWFWDATPNDNSEFNISQTLWRNLSGATQTAGYNFGAATPQTIEAGYRGANNGSNPAVAGNFDLLSVAFHEVGHALGMSAANSSTVAQTGDLDYDFATVNVFGQALAAKHPTGNVAHLQHNTTLMFPSTSLAIRTLPSHTDLFCMAAVHSYTTLDIPRRELYGGTDWNTNANWSGNAVPGADDEAFVRRSGPAGEARDVTLSGNGVAGVLTVSEQSSVHTSNRLLALGTGIVDAGTIFVETGGSLTASTVTVQNTGVLQIAGGGAFLSGALRILNNSTATFSAGALSCATLEVSGGRLFVSSGADKVVQCTALSITPTGRIDLTNNKTIVDYVVLDPTPIQTIRQKIQSGYNGGPWNGNGITTSMGDASHALGYADNTVLGLGSFGGATVDASSVLVKFTYFGDSDLNGQVDVADLGNLASHWQSSGVWTDGDFDYTGSVDVNDLGLLASNWQAGVGSPLGPSLADALSSMGLPSASVPEPASVGLVLAVALKCHRRCRRR